MASIYESKKLLNGEMAERFEPKTHQPLAENAADSKKKLLNGEMAERLNAAVSKTVILGNRYREFESLSLRSKIL